ncbi:sporulation protein [Shewanella litorisediminis]|uniref:Sporulation protein n=1 Tax=Shewanella litorisediminis TaxID=1173586 RepID=A0ABX7G185_9GAMM|nr:sporulation protein [Shewanella litorisediminis]MCL2919033.1 sporulation protein [Shewanella litorisediminis]QRH01097.1 sporulation protein [Shewanella litorisediminis]
MFKKILAAVGIGSAKVDTRLHQSQLLPGQTFSATIVVQGGDVAQKIDGIDLALMTKAKVSTDNGDYFKNHCLARWRVAERFEIQPGEVREIPFSGQLHPETPFTALPVRNNQCRVWLQTGADIDSAIDPTDADVIDILPTPLLGHVLNAMQELGFALTKADVEQGYLSAPGFRSRSGCYQELEFHPRSFGFSSLREVEISLVCDATETHLLIELDRAFRGDGYRAFSIANNASAAEVFTQLKHYIR